MPGGESSLGQVRAPAPFSFRRPGEGGRGAGGCAPGEAPLPAGGSGGQLSPEEVWGFFCPPSPLSAVARSVAGERADISYESRELAGLEGSGGGRLSLSQPSRGAEAASFTHTPPPHPSPARTRCSLRGGARKKTKNHERGTPRLGAAAGFPSPRPAGGFPGLLPLSVAPAAAVPRFPRRGPGGGGLSGPGPRSGSPAAVGLRRPREGAAVAGDAALRSGGEMAPGAAGPLAGVRGGEGAGARDPPQEPPVRSSAGSRQPSPSRWLRPRKGV